MENTKYGKQREGRWIPIRAKAQDTRANLNSWETHPVRKRWDIGLLRALSLWIMMMMMMMIYCINASFVIMQFLCLFIRQAYTNSMHMHQLYKDNCSFNWLVHCFPLSTYVLTGVHAMRML